MFEFYSKVKFGLTLVEVIVAVGIFTLMIGAVVSLFLVGFRTKDVVFEQLATQNEGRKIVQDFVNELRRATASSIGAYPVEMASTTQIIFYTNIDKDSLRERVRYFLAGTTLKKGIIKPTGNPLTYNTATEQVIDVAHSITNGSIPLFSYYDENFAIVGDPLLQPVNVSQVRLVEVNLTFEKNPNTSPRPFTIQAKAAIRNLKSN